MYMHTHTLHLYSSPSPSVQIPERLKLTMELLKKELAVATLQQRLGKEVEYSAVCIQTTLPLLTSYP